jgi:hypothetical protein
MSDANMSLHGVLWKLCEENYTQVRHHETQRSVVVGVILAVAVAAIGLITFDHAIAGPTDIPPALLLIVIGIFGAGFSMKHYERLRLHAERARRYRNALDRLFPGRPIKELKIEADLAIAAQFPWLNGLQLHYWWLVLNLAIAALGGALLYLSAFSPIVVT